MDTVDRIETRLQPSASPHEVQRWSIETLRPFIPNASASTWRYTLVPMLEKRGVLRRVGGRWHGRRADIEAALYPQPAIAQVAP